MPDELVQCEVVDGVCTLTLNRPEKLNALSVETFVRIDEHLNSLVLAEIGCVLLRANGRSFCAGHDLDDLGSGSESGEAERFEAGVVERLATLPMPVVAAVQGHCYTGGLELALAADIIIAADTARFADTHAKWDLVPIWGLSQRLPRRVGIAKAKEMMFASQTYSGVEAVAMGLANRCVPESELAAAAEAFCASIMRNSRRSNRAMKKLVDDTEGMPLVQGLAWELYRSEGHGPDFAARLAEMRK
jgi:enoyl-CoA hydratase